MRKPHVYHSGDTVRILNPVIVDRVGYPFDTRAEAGRILQAHENDIASLLHKIAPDVAPEPAASSKQTPLLSDLVTAYRNEGHPFWPIALKLAYHIGGARRLGGTERRLWTSTRPELDEQTVLVVSKRAVHTGRYYAPSSGYGPDYDYDYEPGGLTNRRSHLLLRVARLGMIHAPEDAFEIEATNVAPA